ncbi:Hypothetical predicted protein [Olea europaea subsp. europaea]|uniref:Uncharacterized protein n=1 Tax=Olea europaea subsp. europaea TaxID=158383 RepID=A0A8S0PJN3_OLEEU|nr:Hypothetical predicted protein [Olea europaea subsp. europaea]
MTTEVLKWGILGLEAITVNGLVRNRPKSSGSIHWCSRRSLIPSNEKELAGNKLSQGMKMGEEHDFQGNEKNSLKMEITTQDYDSPGANRGHDPGNPPPANSDYAFQLHNIDGFMDIKD